MDKFIRILILVFFAAALMLAGWMLYRLLSPRPTGGLIELPTLPQPTPTIYASAATVVERVQKLSRLETASYHIEKVITAESGQGPLGFLFGDKLLLVAYGEVIAGVDLSRIRPQDVQVTADGTVYVVMPPPEIFVATLDNSRTYVYDRRTGVAGLNPQLETAARQEAEKMILQAALEDGILETADENAREVLRALLWSMKFEHVIFVQSSADLPTSTPVPTLTATGTPKP